MIEEPKHRKAKYFSPTSWRPWYVSISDWMIRNPGGDLADCARDLGRHAVTIRYIVNSDMFREFHAQRRQEWREHHDFAIVSRMTKVATKSLDVLLEKMDKQADKIPMQLITELATSSLDRLGYAPKTGPAVQVNVGDNRTQTINAPVTAAALEEARDALRAAERKRAIESRENLDVIDAKIVEARVEKPGSDPEVVSDSTEEST